MPLSINEKKISKPPTTSFPLRDHFTVKEQEKQPETWKSFARASLQQTHITSNFGTNRINVPEWKWWKSVRKTWRIIGGDRTDLIYKISLIYDLFYGYKEHPLRLLGTRYINDFHNTDSKAGAKHTLMPLHLINFYYFCDLISLRT